MDDHTMNDWWFRLVHAHTRRHERNIGIAAAIINSAPRKATPGKAAYNPPSSRFEYAKGIMKGCGCDVLA